MPEPAAYLARLLPASIFVPGSGTIQLVGYSWTGPGFERLGGMLNLAPLAPVSQWAENH
jgi:hypothetical protein